MDLSQLEDTIRRLDSHIQGMRQAQDEKQRQADDLDSDASGLERQMAEQIAEANRIASENDFVDTTIDTVQAQYSKQQEQKQQQAQEMRDEADRLNREIAEAENVLNELKQTEGYMRDYVQTARGWMDSARDIMS